MDDIPSDAASVLRDLKEQRAALDKQIEILERGMAASTSRRLRGAEGPLADRYTRTFTGTYRGRKLVRDDENDDDSQDKK